MKKKTMKKAMKTMKIVTMLLMLFFVGSVFAGPEALHGIGVSQTLCDLIPQMPIGILGAGLLLPITPQQTGLVVAYKNKELIADRVMPISTLQQKVHEFKWFKRTLGDSFTNRNTKVGRLSGPTQVDFSGTEQSDIAVPFGLELAFPYSDLNQLTPELRARQLNDGLEYLTNLLLLDRETRVAGIVQNAANYEAAQVKTCAAADRIGTNDDVYGMIMEMFDDAVVRPNRFGLGQKAFTALRKDPSVVGAYYPNGNGKGVLSLQQLAELFEVDEIIVGKSRINTTKNPDAPVLSPCWGNHLWAHYYEPLSNLKSGIAWGMTAQVGERIASSRVDEKLGLEGGEWAKSGFYHKEVVTAPAAGVLIKDIAA